MTPTERSRPTRRNDTRPKVIEAPVVADTSVDKEMVATRNHFRVVQTGPDGARTLVLFRGGVAVPRSMLELPTLAAVWDATGGCLVPADEGGDDV